MPALATPPEAALAENDVPISNVAVPKVVRPPPRPFPARAMLAPPVAKFELIEVFRTTNEVRPVAKIAPPSALPPGWPAAEVAPPVAVLKPNELLRIVRSPALAAIAPPQASEAGPFGLSMPIAAHSSMTLSAMVSDPLRRKMQPPAPAAGTPPAVIEPSTRPFCR